MPEPVVPHEFYEQFRNILKQNDNDADTISKFQSLIVQLPGANQCLLLYVLDLLAVFDRKSDHNKMNAFNLAVIFQPGILSHPSHAQQPDELKESQETLEFLIKHQDHFLFALTSKTQQDQSSGKHQNKVLNSPISSKGEILITPTDSDDEDNNGWEVKKSSSLTRSKTSYAKSKSPNNRKVAVDMSNTLHQQDVNMARDRNAGDVFAINKGANISRRATTPSRRLGSNVPDSMAKRFRAGESLSQPLAGTN